MTLLEGIRSRSVETSAGTVEVLERSTDTTSTPADRTVLLFAGESAPASVWQELLQDLPSDVRAIAVGEVAEEALAEVIADTHSQGAHVVGWLTGAATAARLAQSAEVGSLTLAAPLSLPEPVPHVPFLWIDGDQDALLAESISARLSDLGLASDWADTAAFADAQAVDAARATVDELSDADEAVTGVIVEGVGHAPHLERPAIFRRALLTRIGYLGPQVDPAPPTEAIILSSSD